MYLLKFNEIVKMSLETERIDRINEDSNDVMTRTTRDSKSISRSYALEKNCMLSDNLLRKINSSNIM